MQESAFGCGQLAPVMRLHALIKRPAKGETVIGGRGERREQVLTDGQSVEVFTFCAQVGAKV